MIITDGEIGDDLDPLGQPLNDGGGEFLGVTGQDRVRTGRLLDDPIAVVEQCSARKSQCGSNPSGVS
jgi:hypothetical protein